jgi:hypothetical protein
MMKLGSIVFEAMRLQSMYRELEKRWCKCYCFCRTALHLIKGHCTGNLLVRYTSRATSYFLYFPNLSTQRPPWCKEGCRDTKALSSMQIT